MYKYWGYGLSIASEIEFPELLPSNFETADLIIRQGKTPGTLKGDNVVYRSEVCMSPAEHLLKLRDTANYYTANGNLILVEPAAGADIKSVRLFLLSSCMAAILHQRDTISLHASAVIHGGDVSMFCGSSGAGKSTTLTMLRQRGYSIFSDDVCVLKTDPGAVKVLPSYPMIKLREDSFVKTGMGSATAADKIRPLIDKYALFFHDTFDIKPRRVNKIFVLNTQGTTNAVNIRILSPVEAFRELQENTYRPAQISAMQKRASHFAAISKLTANAKVYKITRQQGINTLDRVVDLIEHILNSAD